MEEKCSDCGLRIENLQPSAFLVAPKSDEGGLPITHHASRITHHASRIRVHPWLKKELALIGEIRVKTSGFLRNGHPSRNVSNAG
jgi:hypothetical protein